jgi:hypothetical protein
MARATTVVIASNDCAGDPLRIKCDSSAGALDGLGKRGTSVGIANHGRAGDEPEGLAQNLASSKFCDIGRRRTLARDGASREAARMGRASVHQPHDVERWTSPTTQGMARDVPERSEDAARPVTCPVAGGKR